MIKKNSLIFSAVWQVVLVELYKGSYMHKMCKDLGLTFSHVIKIVKEFEKRGIVIPTKKGRTKHFVINQKYKELCEACIITTQFVNGGGK